MSKKLLLHAFNIEKKGSDYYLPYSHWIYVMEMVKSFDKVIILAGCKIISSNKESVNILIKDLSKIEVYELPISSSGTYISSIRYFFHYARAYRNIKGVTTYYSRYPTPFGWLQKKFAPSTAKRIIHYVGDPIDAAKNNPNFSKVKKALLTKGFLIEDKLYQWACRGAKVFTNGTHLAEKLKAKSISANALISSTLSENDFYYKDKNIAPETAEFIYLGYLRTAKGVETIIRAFKLYNKKFPESKLKIIGSGEFEQQLKSIVLDEKVNNISFLGRIENRELINKHLRMSDVFLFASLSEGSPRVVLEAISNGLAVISTPVGSLPDVFENNKSIVFADFNNPKDFFEKMFLLTSHNELYNSIRCSSYNKIKEFTVEKFIRTIFDD